MASTLLAPHPKQLGFDPLGNGYVFEPASGDVRPLPPTAAAGSANDGGGRSGRPDQAGAPVAPPHPDTVPPGSMYSPSLHLWRSPDGAHFFDEEGTMLE